MTEEVIRSRDLSVFFGELAAVHGVELTLRYGERVGLVGPNGCGKSTLLNTLVGAIEPTSGEVRVAGRSTAGRRPSALVAAGMGVLGRSFQSPFLVGELSISENCLLAAWGHSGERLTAVATPWRQPRVSEAREVAEWAMETVGLAEAMRERRPGTVPFGVRKLAEVARVLAAKPRFLLLDEPTSGLSRAEADQFCQALAELSDPVDSNLPLGFLVVDHDMKTIEMLCDEVCLMSEGEILNRDRTSQLLGSEPFTRIYLGATGPASEVAP